MTTVTQVNLTCDVCGDTDDVKTRTFGLDGRAYEIDLCRKDGDALGQVAARYIAQARKVTAKRRRRPREGAKTSRSPRQKGIYVYGILPADIEVAGGIPGVGEHPGLLRDVRCDGLAALISEVDSSGRLGSPDDLRTHREILDATAAEVPVLPLRFGTVLASEDAVAKDLLTARHDEFTAALDRLEGRTEFQVKGRYVTDAVPGEGQLEEDRPRKGSAWPASRWSRPTSRPRSMSRSSWPPTRSPDWSGRSRTWPASGPGGSTSSCWGPWPPTTSR